MIRVLAIPCLSSRPRDRGLRVRGMLDEGAVDFVVVRVVEVIELVGGEEGVLLRGWPWKIKVVGCSNFRL